MKRATYLSARRAFEMAHEDSRDATHTAKLTARGLLLLTELVGDLAEQVEALRKEVKAAREK